MSVGFDASRPRRSDSLSRERDTFTWLASLNGLFVLLAVVSYRGRFDFWSFPLSDLGVWRTPDGKPNTLSALLFALYLTVGGLLMASYAVGYRRGLNARWKRTKTLFAWMTAVGFFVALSPNDVLHVHHVAGCVAMIGGLWFLANILGIELISLGHTYEAMGILVHFHISFIPYAYTYLRGMESKHAFQKLAFFGLITTLMTAAQWIYRIDSERVAVVDKPRSARSRSANTSAAVSPRTRL